jgi:hypothetical protein
VYGGLLGGSGPSPTSLGQSWLARENEAYLTLFESIRAMTPASGGTWVSAFFCFDRDRELEKDDDGGPRRSRRRRGDGRDIVVEGEEMTSPKMETRKGT